jgi:hypothetical protein
LSSPVAAKLSGSSRCGTSFSTPPRPPPAAIAPGPAGFGAAAFFAPALGALTTFAGAAASSSASRRAASALRARSAARLSSASAAFLLFPFAPSAHSSAALRSYARSE